MTNAVMGVQPGQTLRRLAAGLCVTAVPLLYNMPAGAGLQYNAVWGATFGNYWGGVLLDAGLFVTCFFSPLNAALCGGLAIV